MFSTHVEDEQDEEQQQDDLNADDQQLREEVSQHRLHGAHTWGRDATKHPRVYRLRSKPLIRGNKKINKTVHHSINGYKE